MSYIVAGTLNFVNCYRLDDLLTMSCVVDSHYLKTLHTRFRWAIRSVVKSQLAIICAAPAETNLFRLFPVCSFELV
ncbi:hypothetical protein VTN96DRAFT_3849 [Rasamsonia emersonii]